MPYTPQEISGIVNLILTGCAGDIENWRWLDGTSVTDQEYRDVLAFVAYVQRTRRRHTHAAQRRGYRLLRSLLNTEQNCWLNRLGYFQVTTASGTTYRLAPRRGHAERVEWHGSRWFVRKSYCLHDDRDSEPMPPADVTIGHLLLLTADESLFLATANESARDDCLWNSDYLRRMRAARRERELMGAAS